MCTIDTRSSVPIYKYVWDWHLLGLITKVTGSPSHNSDIKQILDGCWPAVVCKCIYLLGIPLISTMYQCILHEITPAICEWSSRGLSDVFLEIPLTRRCKSWALIILTVQLPRPWCTTSQRYITFLPSKDKAQDNFPVSFSRNGELISNQRQSGKVAPDTSIRIGDLETSPVKPTSCHSPFYNTSLILIFVCLYLFSVKRMRRYTR